MMTDWVEFFQIACIHRNGRGGLFSDEKLAASSTTETNIIAHLIDMVRLPTDSGMGISIEAQEWMGETA